MEFLPTGLGRCCSGSACTECQDVPIWCSGGPVVVILAVTGPAALRACAFFPGKAQVFPSLWWICNQRGMDGRRSGRSRTLQGDLAAGLGICCRRMSLPRLQEGQIASA